MSTGKGGGPRIVSIMQPTYLPYLGYFDLILRSDVFVFLDDCQFERKSWQQWNRIPGPGGDLKLFIPVQKQPLQTLIQDILIDDSLPWRDAHLATVREIYADRPHRETAAQFMRQVLAPGSGRLADLTCGAIEMAARHIGWGGEFIRASTLGCGGRRSHHLVEILHKLGADLYLSPLGSRAYIEADGVLAEAGLPVVYRSFQPVPYDQGREPYIPYMAFADALANLGWEGVARHLEIIGRQGYVED